MFSFDLTFIEPGPPSFVNTFVYVLVGGSELTLEGEEVALWLLTSLCTSAKSGKIREIF